MPALFRAVPGRFLSSLPALLACAHAHAAPPEPVTHAFCDGAPFQTVVHPAAARFDARAVWLDRRFIRWPGVAPDSVFKLYRSPLGGIAAPVGGKVTGAAGALLLAVGTTPPAAATRFPHVAGGVLLQVADGDVAALPGLHRQQLVLVQEDARGIVRAATRVQAAGALDDLYAPAASLTLGADADGKRTRFTLWAPTAQQAAVCVYDGPHTPARTVLTMRFDARTGAWHADAPHNLSGTYYRYAVDVPVDGAGIVRNLVTDPYSVSLSADSHHNAPRSYITRLDAPRLTPGGWDADKPPSTVRRQTDMTVYELHVRDFSIGDASVDPARRGKYTAFLDPASNGMRHLAALARSGLTDVHLLPVYDFATVPETGCVTPKADTQDGPAGERLQAAVRKTYAVDCYN
jgi:pullulanase